MIGTCYELVFYTFSFTSYCRSTELCFDSCESAEASLSIFALIYHANLLLTLSLAVAVTQFLLFTPAPASTSPTHVTPYKEPTILETSEMCPKAPKRTYSKRPFETSATDHSSNKFFGRSTSTLFSMRPQEPDKKAPRKLKTQRIKSTRKVQFS